jgi:hypothetical protein
MPRLPGRGPAEMRSEALDERALAAVTSEFTLAELL